MSELAEIRATLLRLERQGGEIKGELIGMNKRLDERARDHEDLEKRTRTLEGAHHHGAGRASIFGTIAGFVGGLISAFLAGWGARNL